MRLNEHLDAVRKDLAYAWRAMRRAPGFALTAVLTLALGIGANTAMFGVVNATLLRPLPYAQPSRLVMVWNHWTNWPQTWLSQPEAADYAQQHDVFASFAPFSTGAVNLTGNGEPERVSSAFIPAGFLATVGVHPRQRTRFYCAGRSAERRRRRHARLLIVATSLCVRPNDRRTNDRDQRRVANRRRHSAARLPAAHRIRGRTRAGLHAGAPRAARRDAARQPLLAWPSRGCSLASPSARATRDSARPSNDSRKIIRTTTARSSALRCCRWTNRSSADRAKCCSCCLARSRSCC